MRHVYHPNEIRARLALDALMVALHGDDWRATGNGSFSGETTMYKVFTRTWWRRNASYPGGREPGAGRKTTIARNIKTEDEARAICKRYNDTHDPGFLSRKAEYDEQ